MQRQWTRRTWFAASVISITAAYIAAFRTFPLPDWTLLVDFSLTLPLLYYALFRPALKKWLLRWVQLIGFGILLGSLIIPPSSRLIWPGLEMARNTALGLLLPIELAVFAGIAYAIWKLARLDGDIDNAMRSAITERLGTSVSANLVLFEARVWLYALGKLKRVRYTGARHFSYARQQGNASNQLGFIIAILFELPLAHMLLHFIWSPRVAWIASALSAWGLLYLVAEYRATLLRPVSIDSRALLIRYGILAADAEIAWGQIRSIAQVQQQVRRQVGVRRYKQMGELNIVIHLQPGVELPNVFGSAQPITEIHLGIDNAEDFIEAVRSKIRQQVDVGSAP